MTIVFGCVSRLVSCASRSKRARSCFPARSRRRSLIAAGRRNRTWCALYTTPMPPAPIFSPIVYCPSRLPWRTSFRSQEIPLEAIAETTIATVHQKRKHDNVALSAHATPMRPVAQQTPARTGPAAQIGGSPATARLPREADHRPPARTARSGPRNPLVIRTLFSVAECPPAGAQRITIERQAGRDVSGVRGPSFTQAVGRFGVLYMAARDHHLLRP